MSFRYSKPPESSITRNYQYPDLQRSDTFLSSNDEVSKKKSKHGMTTGTSVESCVTVSTSPESSRTRNYQYPDLQRCDTFLSSDDEVSKKKSKHGMTSGTSVESCVTVSTTRNYQYPDLQRCDTFLSSNDEVSKNNLKHGMTAGTSVESCVTISTSETEESSESSANYPHIAHRKRDLAYKNSTAISPELHFPLQVNRKSKENETDLQNHSDCEMNYANKDKNKVHVFGYSNNKPDRDHGYRSHHFPGLKSNSDVNTKLIRSRKIKSLENILQKQCSQIKEATENLMLARQEYGSMSSPTSSLKKIIKKKENAKLSTTSYKTPNRFTGEENIRKYETSEKNNSDKCNFTNQLCQIDTWGDRDDIVHTNSKLSRQPKQLQTEKISPVKIALEEVLSTKENGRKGKPTYLRKLRGRSIFEFSVASSKNTNLTIDSKQNEWLQFVNEISDDSSIPKYIISPRAHGLSTLRSVSERLEETETNSEHIDMYDDSSVETNIEKASSQIFHQKYYFKFSDSEG